MPVLREVDMCPPCMSKLQGEISKLQEEMKKFQESEVGKHTKKTKKEEIETEDTKTVPHFGEYARATPEEIEECLSSLSYFVPICNFCKNHKNISIIKIPPDAIKIQNPEDCQKK